VNVDNGDIDVHTDSTHYTITLCEVSPFDVLSYPYSTPSSCYDSKGWNAQNYMDFDELTSTTGANTIDANEIAYKVRLDERVVPVDLPNSDSTITIKHWIEVAFCFLMFLSFFFLPLSIFGFFSQHALSQFLFCF